MLFFCLIFAIFLWESQFICLQIKHNASFQQKYITRGFVFLYHIYLELFLPLSKTNIFCIEVTFIIVAVLNNLYAIASIKNLLTQFFYSQRSLQLDLGLVSYLTQNLVTKMICLCLRYSSYVRNYLSYSFCSSASIST